EDPLNEQDHEAVPGLIQKYPGRALWRVTDRCPVHCRFCFRRCRLETNTESRGPDISHRHDTILDALARQPDIHEVILSGGEPLSVPVETLTSILTGLAGVSHIRLIRLHTRMPVVAPDRVPGCIDTMARRVPLFRTVLHINHPREWSPECRDVIRRWISIGIPVLSQSVLLAGVNDDAGVLRRLFMDLICDGVQPYYLHMLDPAPGTAHFRVPEQRARDLIRRCRETLPGYAVPRLVRDIPGRASKTLL
ncbi:MAG TPA: 4Fe-4S cluster-binding domain-containing protein, partial [bacterium]|nr:4Fe-4S cluster-binding domain-containing protein [bacterium]